MMLFVLGAMIGFCVGVLLGDRKGRADAERNNARPNRGMIDLDPVVNDQRFRAYQRRQRDEMRVL